MANTIKLKEGKALGAFDGFVETFNWLVDFCTNLKGEGEESGDDENSSSSGIFVDRTTDDHPVIRGGGSGGSSVKTKKLTLQSGDESNIRFITEENDDEIIVTINVFWK